MKTKSSKEEIKQSKSYNIVRFGSGYVIIDESGKHQCTEDMFQVVIKKLERLIRKELGI